MSLTDQKAAQLNIAFLCGTKPVFLHFQKYKNTSAFASGHAKRVKLLFEGKGGEGERLAALAYFHISKNIKIQPALSALAIKSNSPAGGKGRLAKTRKNKEPALGRLR